MGTPSFSVFYTLQKCKPFFPLYVDVSTPCPPTGEAGLRPNCSLRRLLLCFSNVIVYVCYIREKPFFICPLLTPPGFFHFPLKPFPFRNSSVVLCILKFQSTDLRFDFRIYPLSGSFGPYLSFNSNSFRAYQLTKKKRQTEINFFLLFPLQNNNKHPLELSAKVHSIIFFWHFALWKNIVEIFSF